MTRVEFEQLLKYGSRNEHRLAIIDAVHMHSDVRLDELIDAIFKRGEASGRLGLIQDASQDMDAFLALQKEIMERASLNAHEAGREYQSDLASQVERPVVVPVETEGTRH